uniref:Uncharacterized protein n=1 Tax=Felis catus TaxID=9685 RepID=A0ABI7WAR6_FELCA
MHRPELSELCPTFLPIKTFRYNSLLLARVAKINNTRNRYWQGCGEKGNLAHRWWECKLVQPLWKTGWSFLSKVKTEIPYHPAIALLGIYLPKEYTSSNSKRYMRPYVYNSIAYNSQDMEAAQVSIHR